MLYYIKIKVSEVININKSKKSKECMICHYEQEVRIGCHDISMMAYELENIAILNMKSVGYRCVIWNMTKNDTINMLNNSKLDNKESL